MKTLCINQQKTIKKGIFAFHLENKIIIYI